MIRAAISFGLEFALFPKPRFSLANMEAKARIAGITEIAARTFRQAIIVINRIARRAVRPRIAAAAGVAAGFGLNFTDLRN